jgi:hypothetical protein
LERLTDNTRAVLALMAMQPIVEVSGGTVKTGHGLYNSDMRLAPFMTGLLPNGEMKSGSRPDGYCKPEFVDADTEVLRARHMVDLAATLVGDPVPGGQVKRISLADWTPETIKSATIVAGEGKWMVTHRYYSEVAGRVCAFMLTSAAIAPAGTKIVNQTGKIIRPREIDHTQLQLNRRHRNQDTSVW